MKKIQHTLAILSLSILSFTAFAKPATEASVEKALKLSDISGTLAQSQQEMRPVYQQQAEDTIKQMNEEGMSLVGAVHDYTDPVTGKGYLYFPIREV